MQPGDRVLFVAERGSEPRQGTVAARYGIWVNLDLDDGSHVEQVLAAESHFQSPCGHYCVKSEQLTTQ